MLNETNNESSEGEKYINNELSATEILKTIIRMGRVNGNNPSEPNSKLINRGGNFAAGASASTIVAEDGQTPGTLPKNI